MVDFHGAFWSNWASKTTTRVACPPDLPAALSIRRQHYRRHRMTTSESRIPQDFAGSPGLKGNGRIRLAIGVAVILLTLIWLTSTPDSEQTDSGIVPPSPITPIHREAGATSPSGTAESPSPVTPAVSSARLEIPAQQTDGEIARALIAALRNGQQQLDADSLLNRALELQQQGRVTDAYLLLFFNARNGHGPSAMLLGELHDPAHFTTGSTPIQEPDPLQAFKWYSLARQSGVEQAEERLAVLRSHIEQAAAEGDGNARRLLLNWR